MGVRAPGFAVAVLAAVTMAVATPQPAVAVEGDIVGAGSETAIAGKYIVELRDTAKAAGADTLAAVSSTARELTTRFPGRVGRTYQHVLQGFEVTASPTAARRIAADPSVAAVHQNTAIELYETQAGPPSWGLDRIDQRDLPLSLTYRFPTRANRVRAYIMDTGIRLDHPEFAGRITQGRDFFSNDDDPSDCEGHGTAVAGVLAGTTFGVAKNATIIPLKTYGCNHNEIGDAGMAVAAMDWTINNHLDGEPAVFNWSGGGQANLLLDNAVQRVIADGITVVAAAGNGNKNNCTASPSRMSQVLLVGGTDIQDNRWVSSSTRGSNFGSCLDLFAPGRDVVSASRTNPTGGAIRGTGTSYAAPHVAGAAALYLDHNPTATPAAVHQQLVSVATTGRVTDPGTGSPNRLLFLEQLNRTSAHKLYVDPPTVSVNPDEGISPTVYTQLTWGLPHDVRLTASGMPAGMIVSFQPATISSESESAMAINTLDTIALGTYQILITGTGQVTSTATLTVRVTNEVTGCAASGPDTVVVNKVGTFRSSLIISGCPRAPSATANVNITINSRCEEVLQIELVSPTRNRYRLKSRSGTPAVCSEGWRFNRSYNLAGANLSNGIWKVEIYTICTNCGPHTLRPWSLTL